MRKFLCILVVIAVIAGIYPVCYAEDTTNIDIIEIQSNDSMNVIGPELVNGSLSFKGKYLLGGGYDITLKIVDETGSIYAIGETVTKNKGAFSFDIGLDKNAGGKTLTAYIMGSDDAEAYKITFVYDNASVTSDFITVEKISDKESIILNAPYCDDVPVIFSGVSSDGAGWEITYRIIDTQNKTVYKKGKTTTKNAGVFSFSAEMPKESYGRSVTAYFIGEDDIEESYVIFTFSGGIAKNKLRVSEYIEQIESLVSECESKNISTEYEKTNLSVIKKFNGFLDGYYSQGLIDEYEHNFITIINIASQTVSDLKAYLNGTKNEKAAPVYVSSDIAADGESLIASVSEKGVIKQQPVFFNGYGHWSDAISDYDSFSDLGINCTQYEIGPNSVLKSIKSDGSYEINTTAVQNIKNVFKTAEDNNLSIVFLTAMHYFPNFIYEKYPEIVNYGSRDDFPTMVPYNPTHPEVKRAIEAFLRAVIPEIKDYKSLQSICLANEPMFHLCSYPDYYLPAYREFLKNKYGSISVLNKAYGKSYSSFNAVTMPSAPSSVSARYSDYREFSDTILTEWFSWIRNVIKDIDPDIPVHVKCSAYISSADAGNRRNFCSTNHEQWAEVSDLNGCDAWAIYEESGSTLQGKMMWYDFMTSHKNMPIVNSEDHILRERDDGEIVYNDAEYRMNMADVWQGAIHGRASSVYWLWDKSSRTKEGTWYYNSNLSRRADYVAGIGKINHDLNRLANEVTAIQNKKPRVAVLYSNHTQVGIQYHSSAMYEAYRYLVNHGEKVFIANDTTPQKINENENLELLIVPVCEYMPESVWCEIKKFEEKGKKVIFAEYNNKYYAENGTALDSELKSSVLNNAVRVSFGGAGGLYVTGCNKLYKAINEVIGKYEKDIIVYDESENTEWTSVKYGDGYIVNLCNCSDDYADISVSLSKSEISLFDLTENEIMNSADFVLEPYETKLIKIIENRKINEIYLSDGTIADKIEKGDMVSKISLDAKPGTGYFHILAVYSENELKNIEMSEGKADIYGKINSSITINIPDDIELSTTCVKSFVLNSLEELVPYMPAKTLKNK